MTLNSDLKKFLEYKAYLLRRWSIIMPAEAGSGHTTSCLSAADIVATLFFYTMHYDPYNFDNPDNDHFILSKGHASPLLYAVWSELGLVPEKELYTFREINSNLEGHPTLRFPYTEVATGSLGMGLSFGAGMAKCAKMDRRDYRTYVLLGDGEVAEGQVWEATEISAYYKLNNLIGIIDCNRLGQSQATMEGHHYKKYEDMFTGFGWQTFTVNGHDVAALADTFDKAKKITDKPVMIIAETYKGYGIEQVQDKNGFHGKPFKKDQLPAILDELAKRFPEAANYTGDYDWKPIMPTPSKHPVDFPEPERMPEPNFTKGNKLATRKAFGQALAALGTDNEYVVTFDGDVENSTYTQDFQAAHPDRFVECFIAEQNMVSMAEGFNRRGRVPFVATFASFLSRAHDQIRMAAIGDSSIKLVGSHAGVSIGQDGPSQMGLEDIAMMRATPNSIIFYPSDAVSTWRLLQKMVDYQTGMSYLRTTRMDTPIIYDNDEAFEIGGCKVLRKSNNDKVCVIGAGITLHNALKAYEQLKKENINIAVIDLYCIKPLDFKTLTLTAEKAGNTIIVVEDHYAQGGIGEAVMYALEDTTIDIYSLAVNQLPRSGKPDELMALVGIDTAAIIKKVKEVIH